MPSFCARGVLLYSLKITRRACLKYLIPFFLYMNMGVTFSIACVESTSKRISGTALSVCELGNVIVLPNLHEEKFVFMVVLYYMHDWLIVV